MLKSVALCWGQNTQRGLSQNVSLQTITYYLSETMSSSDALVDPLPAGPVDARMDRAGWVNFSRKYCK